MAGKPIRPLSIISFRVGLRRLPRAYVEIHGVELGRIPCKIHGFSRSGAEVVSFTLHIWNSSTIDSGRDHMYISASANFEWNYCFEEDSSSLY